MRGREFGLGLEASKTPPASVMGLNLRMMQMNFAWYGTRDDDRGCQQLTVIES